MTSHAGIARSTEDEPGDGLSDQVQANADEGFAHPLPATHGATRRCLVQEGAQQSIRVD